LLVYPIIAVLFAMGKVGSYLISQQGSGIVGALSAIMAVVTLVIPLLLIPFSFRLAGGVLGRLHDVVSGGRQRLHAMGEGRREAAKGRLSRVQAGRKAWAADKAVHNPIGQGITAIPVVGKHFGAIATGAEQGVSRSAADYGLDEDKAREAANRWQGTGMGWSQSSGVAAFQAAVADGTVFKDNEDQINTINRITGGNESLRARVWGNAYAGNKQAGRYDLSPSYGTGMALANAAANGGVFKDAFMGDKSRIGTKVTADDFKMAAVEGARSTSNTELSRLKGMGMDNLTASMTEILGSAETSDVAKAQIIAKVENMKSSGLYMPEALTEKLAIQAINQPATVEVSQEVHAAAAEAGAPSSRAVELRTQAQTSAQNAAAAQRAEQQAARSSVLPTPDDRPTAGQTYNQQRQAGGSFDPRGPGGPLAGEPPSSTPPGAEET
jgi:hypothetical protein